MEVLRINTKGKSKEFLEVLKAFEKEVTEKQFSCRSNVTCFMKGMFFYDPANYQYLSIEQFHKLAVENRLDLGEKAYILINYLDLPKSED